MPIVGAGKHLGARSATIGYRGPGYRNNYGRTTGSAHRAPVTKDELTKEWAAGELTRELFAAIRVKNKDRVRALLELGADVNAYEPVDPEESPGEKLCNCVLILLFLMACPCFLFLFRNMLNSKDQYNKTPLHAAVEKGDPDMVALLLEFGADRNAPASFWNCCCCKKTPTQLVDMVDPVDGDDIVPVEQRAPIKELLMPAREIESV